MSKRPVAVPAVGAAGCRGTRAALLVVGALALAGCGGDEEEQARTAATQATTQATATAKPEAEKRASPPEKAQPETTRSAPQSTVPDAGPTPGTKPAAAGVPVSSGGDNSIQTYGTEGENDPRKQATVALTTYLDARLAGRWAKACAEMSSEIQQSIQALTGGGEQGECAAALRALTVPVPKAALRRAAQVKEVLSFRVEGEQAFLISRSADDKAKYSPMASEDGEWKVAALEPSEFFLGP